MPGGGGRIEINIWNAASALVSRIVRGMPGCGGSSRSSHPAGIASFNSP